MVVQGKESDILSEATIETMKQKSALKKVLQVPNVGHAPMLNSKDQIDPIITFLLE